MRAGIEVVRVKLVSFLDQPQQALFVTPFCPFAAFLVEFANVVYIVDIIPVTLRSAARFASRRAPDIGYTDGFKLRERIEQPCPVGAVRWNVPFECLKKSWVFRRWSLF